MTGKMLVCHTGQAYSTTGLTTRVYTTAKDKTMFTGMTGGHCCVVALLLHMPTDMQQGIKQCSLAGQADIAA